MIPTTAIPLANDPGVPPVSPAAAPEGKSNERVSSKFAALTRKEKMAVQKLQQATAKEQAVNAREEALRQREARMQEFESVRTQSPIKALEMLGYNYNELSQAMLNDGNVTPEMQIGSVRADIEAFKKQQEQKEADAQKREEEASLAEQNEVIENFKGEIQDFIAENKANYPLIELYKQDKLVFASIDEHYNTTGKVASIQEACDHVEKYLEAEVEKAMGVEKIRAKVQPQPKVETKQDPWGYPRQQKTLNNQMSPSAPTKPKRMSEDEKIRYTVNKLWGAK